MIYNSAFVRCAQSRSKRSQELLRPLLQNKRLLAEVVHISDECSRQKINQTSFVLRGRLDVREGDLFEGIMGAVAHYVDKVAADSICQVRFLATNIVQVQCMDADQCWRITNQRLAFSSVVKTPHPSAAVRRVLHARLFVDDYCTREQLRIRYSQRTVFQELKAARKRPYFRGEVLYYYPDGTKRAIAHSTKSTEVQPSVAKAAVQEDKQHGQQQQQQQQQKQQKQQQQQHAATHPQQRPRSATPVPSARRPSPAEAPPPSAVATTMARPESAAPTAASPPAVGGPATVPDPSTSAAAESSVLQPTTRANVPIIQQPAQVSEGWKKSKLPARDPVFQEKIWLRTYKNNSRMKRTAVSIADLHAEQQAKQQRGEGSYSGQMVTCTSLHKHGTLPEMVVADELIAWYASRLRVAPPPKAALQPPAVSRAKSTDVRWR
jgi:hypothetical protein